MDEPALIVNINMASSIRPAIQQLGHPCNNVLADGQQNVAQRFAGIGGIKQRRAPVPSE